MLLYWFRSNYFSPSKNLSKILITIKLFQPNLCLFLIKAYKRGCINNSFALFIHTHTHYYHHLFVAGKTQWYRINGRRRWQAYGFSAAPAPPTPSASTPPSSNPPSSTISPLSILSPSSKTSAPTSASFPACSTPPFRPGDVGRGWCTWSGRFCALLGIFLYG